MHEAHLAAESPMTEQSVLVFVLTRPCGKNNLGRRDRSGLGKVAPGAEAKSPFLRAATCLCWEEHVLDGFA